jgi:hypothetical protein
MHYIYKWRKIWRLFTGDLSASRKRIMIIRRVEAVAHAAAARRERLLWCAALPPDGDGTQWHGCRLPAARVAGCRDGIGYLIFAAAKVRFAFLAPCLRAVVGAAAEALPCILRIGVARDGNWTCEKRRSFVSFLYVSPEPVFANWSFLV